MIKSVKSKRIWAFFIDYLLVSLFLTMVYQIRILNPNYEKYNETYEKYTELISDLDSNEYLSFIESKDYKLINYDLSKYSISLVCINLIVYILYFGGFQFWNKGQTIGKKIMKIKLVSKKDNLKLWQCLLRTVILYSILFEVIKVIVITFVSVNKFYFINNILSVASSFLFYTVVLCILFRKDGRGLHDILCDTDVVLM